MNSIIQLINLHFDISKHWTGHAVFSPRLHQQQFCSVPTTRLLLLTLQSNLHFIKVADGARGTASFVFKVKWFIEFCVTPLVSHTAALFFTADAKRSTNDQSQHFLQDHTFFDLSVGVAILQCTIPVAMQARSPLFWSTIPVAMQARISHIWEQVNYSIAGKAESM
jgi:hypothetical protein